MQNWSNFFLVNPSRFHVFTGLAKKVMIFMIGVFIHGDHFLMSGCFFFLGGGRRGVGSSFSKGGMPNFTIFASISRVVNRNRWQDASHPNLNLPTGWGVLGGSSNLVFGKGSWSNPTGRGLATTMVKKTTSKSWGLILQVGAKTTPFSNPNHPPLTSTGILQVVDPNKNHFAPPKSRQPKSRIRLWFSQSRPRRHHDQTGAPSGNRGLFTRQRRNARGWKGGVGGAAESCKKFFVLWNLKGPLLSLE